MFDDAFTDGNDGNRIVNDYVYDLISVIDQAASTVHQKLIKLKSPKRILTPYGGRLEWILPGRSKLFLHLKDKNKIRHRKRWSQVIEIII